MSDGCNIRSLSRRQKRQREPLKSKVTGNVIGGQVGRGTRGASLSSSGGGVSSPLTEQAYDGTTWYSHVSSDGLFVHEFPAYTEYRDPENLPIIVNHLDPSA